VQVLVLLPDDVLQLTHFLLLRLNLLLRVVQVHVGLGELDVEVVGVLVFVLQEPLQQLLQQLLLLRRLLQHFIGELSDALLVVLGFFMDELLLVFAGGGALPELALEVELLRLHLQPDPLQLLLHQQTALVVMLDERPIVVRPSVPLVSMQKRV